MPVDDTPDLQAPPANAVRPTPEGAGLDQAFVQLFAPQRGGPPLQDPALSAEIRRFPAHAIVRPPAAGLVDDQVRVTHRGDTQVYDSPATLYRSLRDQDHEAATSLAQLQAGHRALNDLMAEANKTLEAAHADRRAAADARIAAETAKRQAEKILRTLGALGALGILCSALIMAVTL